MDETILQRAGVLIEALPHIQRYYGKTVVIKYGGNAMVSEELTKMVMKDIVLLSLVGVRVVLVHGGGPEINDMLGKIGKESKFVDGLRYTDEETVDVVQMVLAGKVNKNLVSRIGSEGGKAVGICGMDSGMIKAEKHREKDIGFVGDIKEIDVSIINDLLENGYIPVVASVGIGSKGESYNINADTAAAGIAAGLQAESLILVTDIRGLLRDKNDESSLISTVNISEVPSLKMQGVISGGMIPKIDCCVHAVRRGVKQTIIIDGRIPHSILLETLSDAGIGTMFIN